MDGYFVVYAFKSAGFPEDDFAGRHQAEPQGPFVSLERSSRAHAELDG
jgi:hypothetical protein